MVGAVAGGSDEQAGSDGVWRFIDDHAVVEQGHEGGVGDGQEVGLDRGGDSGVMGEGVAVHGLDLDAGQGELADLGVAPVRGSRLLCSV